MLLSPNRKCFHGKRVFAMIKHSGGASKCRLRRYAEFITIPQKKSVGWD